MNFSPFRSLLLAWRENAQDLSRARRWRRLSLVTALLYLVGVYALMAVVIWRMILTFLDTGTKDFQALMGMINAGLFAMSSLKLMMAMPESVLHHTSYWRQLAVALRRSLSARDGSAGPRAGDMAAAPDAPSFAPTIPALGTYRVVEPRFAWTGTGSILMWFLWFFVSGFVLSIGLLLVALAYGASLPGGWMGLPPTPQAVIPLLTAAGAILALGVGVAVSGTISLRRRTAQRRGGAIIANELGITFHQPVWSRRERRILWTDVKSFASFPNTEIHIAFMAAHKRASVIYLLDGGANHLMWEVPSAPDREALPGGLDGQVLPALITPRTGLPLLDLSDMMREMAQRLGRFGEGVLDMAEAVALIERDASLAAEVERARGHVSRKLAVEASKRVEKITQRWLALLRDPTRAPNVTLAIQRSGWLARALLPYYPAESPLVEGYPFDMRLERIGAWLRRWYLWLALTPIGIALALALFLDVFSFFAAFAPPHRF